MSNAPSFAKQLSHTPETINGPMSLNPAQARAVEAWAADDRLWTTQETVEFNLRTFARIILMYERGLGAR